MDYRCRPFVEFFFFFIIIHYDPRNRVVRKKYRRTYISRISTYQLHEKKFQTMFTDCIIILVKLNRSVVTLGI